MMLIFTGKGKRPVWPWMSVVSLLYLFMSLHTFVKVANSQEGEGPCIFDEKNLTTSCQPCSSDQWIELVGKVGGKEEKITNENQSCFNNDPITVYYGDVSRIGVGEITSTISQGEYHTAKDQGVNSLLLQKMGLFRYAYTSASATGGGGGGKNKSEEGKTEASGGPDVYLDLDGTEKYYTREYKGEKIFADFQLLEWAGRTSEAQREEKQEQSKATLPERCTSDFRDARPCKSHKHYMLIFQRDNGKIQFYPCNAQEGSNIAAMGAVTKVDKGKLNLEVESPQKIWLSHGRKNIFKHYIDPIFLPEYILRQMAKTEGDSCLAEGDYEDLRTVMDFTFTKHRLLLGMKCGIVIVRGMDTEELMYQVAVLLDESGDGLNKFPDPVNKISASTCCYREKCSSDLVAAYSFDVDREPEDNKFMYISFDLGHRFEKKIVATPHSAVNLIMGMYKFYKKWSDYYDILHHPDEDDRREDDAILEYLRKKPIWDMVLTDEKEQLFAVGVPKKEKRKFILKKVVDIVEKRVPKRRERLQKKGVDVDIDRSPKWVRITLNKRRAKHGWNRNWTDESCDGIPECLEKFEDDKAVEWLLQSPEYNVKTPKRNDDEPFCKEIISILVLPEERHIMALCSIGYGKHKTTSPKEKGGSGRSGELPGDGSDGKVIHSTEATEGEADGEAKSSGRSRRSDDGAKDDEIGDDGGSGDGGDESTEGPDGGGGGGGGSDELQYFALFNFAVKQNLPLIHGYRVSQRIIACKPIKNTMNPDKEIFIQPELIRIPGSSTIVIINCDGVIFSSTNFGNTLFNSAFYYEKDSVEKYCKQDSKHKELTVEGCGEKKDSEHPNYIRSHFLCALNVPPLIIADRSASLLLITFGRFYARGAIAYNRETRLIVGETMRDVDFERRFENFVFPAVNTIGEAVLGVLLKHVYSVPPTLFGDEFYKDKPNIRLVQLPFHNVIKNFQDENLAMCAQAHQKGLGFSECKTISFFVDRHRVTMDINEAEEVKVRVKDDNIALPLWIFSSNEKSVEVKASNTANKTDELNSHNWAVEIKTKPNNKSEEESLVDSFFGSDYNKLNDYSTQVALVNTPTARCHVQPSSTVNVEIGCEGKRLVAHEDRHRPQCLKFRQDFNYTLKRGQYDPKLADFWIHSEGHHKNPFIKLLPNGDLSITYDYASWGCPIEPFRADEFIPDLRILTEDNQNSTLAERFRGKFVLIELFGAQGFSYTKTVGEVERCKRAPQTLEEQLDHWALRQRLFYLASNRLTFPNSTKVFDSADFDIKKNLTGNKIFHNEAVWQQINIWNRANFLSCDERYVDEEMGDEKEDFDDADHRDVLTEEIRNRQYEIMMTRKFEEGDDEEGADFEDLDTSKYDEEEQLDAVVEESGLNKLYWNKKDHQRIYLFLAVAVDEYDSLCNYQTIFAVSLKKRGEMDDLTSILLFLLFMLLWGIAIVGGYFVRRKLLHYTLMRQGKADKLEQTAWLIVYRYEKLIHGKSMGHLFMNSLQFDEGEDDSHGNDRRMSAAAKSAYDKRKAELRMKKTHILAQEQARHEKLQKTFQKQ